MNSKMSKKLVMILEKPSPHFSHWKGLTSMDSLVDSKSCTTNKALSTFLALKWFHIIMNSLMLSELGTTDKSLSTLVTFIGFFTSVNPLMLHK